MSTARSARSLSIVASSAALLLLSWVAPAAAQTAADEPFDYVFLWSDLLGLDGGSGFTGPWFPSGFNASIHDTYDVAPGSLEFGELTASGNRVETAPTPAIAGLGRDLAVPIFAGDPTTRYLALRLRPEGTLHEGAFNGFFGLYLDGSGDADLFVGKPGGGDLGSWVLEGRGGSGQVSSGVPAAVGETVLLVLRAELHLGADVFTLHVDPDPCGIEPGGGAVKNDLDLGDVAAIVVYSTGAFSIDEIRMGATFEEVMRCQVREPFDYVPPGSDLLGQDGGSGLAGPWFPSGFNASIHDTFDVASGSLEFGELAMSGNRVESASTPAIAGLGRNLAATISAGDTMTRYLALLLRPDGALGEGAFNGFFGLYLDGTDDADLFVGKPGSEVVGSWVLENRGGAGQVSSGIAPVVGETSLLVVRADLRPGADTFTLHVDPEPCEPEPSGGTVKGDLDLGDVSALVIYSTGAFSLDEIRMGATFEEVVRAGGIDCAGGGQIPSDCNQDGVLDLSDGICLLGYLFQGVPSRLPCGDGTASDPANATLLDANGDAGLDLSDAVRIFGYLFLGQAPPELGTSCTRVADCPDGPTCAP